MMFRNVAFVTAVSAGAKIKKPQDLWPSFMDGRVQQTDTIMRLTDEEVEEIKKNYERIKKVHGVN